MTDKQDDRYMWAYDDMWKALARLQNAAYDRFPDIYDQPELVATEEQIKEIRAFTERVMVLAGEL